MAAETEPNDAQHLNRRAVAIGLVALPITAGAAAAIGQLNRFNPTARDDLPSPDVPPAIARADPAIIAAAKGLVFGSAVGGTFRTSPEYRAITLKHSNTLIHGAALQWMNVQAAPDGPYNFAFAEQIYAWGHAAGRYFRGHVMMDWTTLPIWLSDMVAAATATEAAAIIERHVRTMATHWRGRFLEWNVVNEPASGGMRRSVWFDRLGEEYIDLALHTAHEADPNARLSINQDGIEMSNRFQRRTLDTYLGLIGRLVDRGVPIRSVGIEGHLRSDSPVDQKGLESFMKELEGMNLSFMISELDVDDRGLPDNPRIRDAGVAATMRDLLDVALAQPHCEGVAVWDFGDHDNWLVRVKGRERGSGMTQRPTLLDENYAPKATWATVIDCLRRARGPSPSARLLPATGATQLIEAKATRST